MVQSGGPLSVTTATKVALIETGERLFAVDGLHGASLRQISAESGRRDNWAAQYHFGSRLGLAVGIFEYRMTPINQRRLEMLRDLGTGGIRELIEAYVIPLFEAIGNKRRPTYYARFVAQVAFDPELDFLTNLLDQPFLSGWSRVLDGLLAALDDLPSSQAVTRVHLMLRMVTGGLADQERFRTLPGKNPWPTIRAVDLVDAAVALLSAPPSRE